MAYIVVLGIEGESGLWQADLSAGTIVPLATPTTGSLKTVSDLRNSGATVIKSVDVAIAVASTAKVASGQFDG